jgi:hypothetical protein
MTTVERALRDHFGHEPARASVSFLGVAPIEVLRFEPAGAERAFVSLGMSSRPMTAATETVVTSVGPRAELMLWIHDAATSYRDVWRQVAVLAASPVVEGIVVTPGMTIDTGQPLATGSRCTGGLIVPSAIPEIRTESGIVQVLQLLPATSAELAWCRVHGGDALRARWIDGQVDLLELGRATVSLD